MRERNLTQVEVAEELDVSQQTVSRWLNDESAPRLEHVPRLARFLKTSAATVRDMIPDPSDRRDLEERIDELEKSFGKLAGSVAELLARQQSSDPTRRRR